MNREPLKLFSCRFGDAISAMPTERLKTIATGKTKDAEEMKRRTTEALRRAVGHV